MGMDMLRVSAGSEGKGMDTPLVSVGGERMEWALSEFVLAAKERAGHPMSMAAVKDIEMM